LNHPPVGGILLADLSGTRIAEEIREIAGVHEFVCVILRAKMKLPLLFVPWGVVRMAGLGSAGALVKAEAAVRIKTVCAICEIFVDIACPLTGFDLKGLFEAREGEAGAGQDSLIERFWRGDFFWGNLDHLISLRIMSSLGMRILQIIVRLPACFARVHVDIQMFRELQIGPQQGVAYEGAVIDHLLLLLAVAAIAEVGGA
jgi:hypothetical protein